MKKLKQIAEEISQESKTSQEKMLNDMLQQHNHAALLNKTEELKITNIVQSKLLSDQLSYFLSEILNYLQGQKPEITKDEMLQGLSQITHTIQQVLEILPKELESLGKIIDKPKENYWTEERLAKTLKESFPQFPEINIPEPLTEIKVTDLQKVIALLTAISKKPDFQKTDITFPELPQFPDTITVDNLGQVVDKLDVLIKKNDVPQEATGFSWTEDAAGNLDTFTEYYANGKVTATGWNLKRVRITDDRSN